MDSTTTCIDTVLGDLSLLKKSLSDLDEQAFFVSTLMWELKKLRTFILCVRRLGNDMHLRTDGNNSNNEGSLGSLLLRIDEVVRRNAQIDIYSRIAFMCKISDFSCEIHLFKEEIEEWYITVTDFLQQLASPTTDQVMEITNSVLENLEDIFSCYQVSELCFVMESLMDKMKLLKSFVRFAMLQRVEHQQLQDLLNHFEAVAVKAAQFSFKCQYGWHDKKYQEEMLFQFSVLQKKIKHIDPNICATYTQALTSSKLSRQLHASILERDDDPIIIMKDFIDSLVCNLWEMLQLDTYPVVSVKDQLQELHGRLRFVRTILVKQPNKLDEKIKDFIADLICDAGLIIFSLYQKDIKIDTELLDLLERMEHIQKQVAEKGPEASAFDFCRTNELGFINYLLENLMDVTSSKPSSNAQSFAQTIKEQLVFLRSVLVEIVDLDIELEEFHSLWNRAMEVAYRVESLIDRLVVGDISNSFTVLFDSIVEDINDIKIASKISKGKIEDVKMNKVARKSSHVPTQSSAPKIDEVVVGFDDESTSITNRLTRGSKKLRIIAIVGMPGQGKTTLVTKVYRCNTVMHHFHVCAFCSISQVFNKKKVLLELLNNIVIKLPEKYLKMTEQDLAEELRRHLKGHRYLIFLDDVWDIQVWSSLAETLPDDYNGSRIILTSRLQDVAPHAMLDEEPHFLRQLTNDESWELLQRKLLHGKGCPPELYELGMQIAENCKGLPLTIVIVAGLLSNMGQENWNEILEGLSSGILSTTVQCMNTLELSYKHLPDYLKPCFLYFGMFPEDQEVSSKTLIRLWIAEGFIRKSNLKSIEDAATDYLMDLIGRSLVLVAKQRSVGSVKACRVHDLLHEFCMKKAKEENFFHLLRGYDELLAFNAPCNLRRLSIQSEPRHFKESRLFCAGVRSILFFAEREGFGRKVLDISFIIHIFKLLRVLDISHTYLVSVFPKEIGLLVRLRYLAVRGDINVIPSSIGNLSYLETFLVESDANMVSLPDTLWNLRKLRHLCVGKHSGFTFAIESLENSSDLYELETCSGAFIFSWDSIEKQMKKFPSIRALKCKLFQNWDDTKNCYQVIFPDFMSQLESLGLSNYYHQSIIPEFLSLPKSLGLSRFSLFRKHVDFEFGLPANLKKLTLSGFELPWSKISSIGKLCGLEVLKLLHHSFSGEIWEMEEGEFSRLRFLKLSGLDFVKWIASDDQFPNLEKLVVDRCSSLEEIPSCLENTSTLEAIEVSDCRPSLTSSVKQIQEVQMDMGNSDLKVLVLREWDAEDRFERSDSDD